MTDLEMLSRRLATMEKRFRWTMRVAGVAAIVITAAAVGAQVRGVPRPGEVLPNGRLVTGQLPVAAPLVEEEVRARQFVLVDSKGMERASLVADGAGSVFLVMFDSERKTRINLSVSNDGPSLVFYDPAAQQRMIVGSTTLVPSHVNEGGVAEKGPASSIVLFDKAGRLLWRQP